MNNKKSMVTVDKAKLEELHAQAVRFKSEVLHDSLALDNALNFFKEIKSAESWSAEQQVNVARWIAYKFLKNRYSWNADKFILEMLKCDILKDYTHFNSFLNPADIGGAYQESYNVFAIVHDLLLKYDIRTWSALTSDEPIDTIERLTRKTFAFGGAPSVKTIEKTFFGLVYHALNENLKLYKVESVDALFTEEKTFNDDTLKAVEKRNFESVFSDLYVVPTTGKTTIKNIDVSEETTNALESIAEKCNLFPLEKLALLFVGACDCSLAGAQRVIETYAGTKYSTSRIRKAFESAMEKLNAKGYNKAMFE